MNFAVIETRSPASADLSGRVRPAGLFAGSVLFGVVLLILVTPAWGQALPPGEGLKTGRFNLYPSLGLEYTEDDNVFYTSTDSASDEFVASGILLLKPRLLVYMPLGSGRVLWSYSPVLRNYTNIRVQQPEKFSHFSDFEASFRPGGNLSITARDHLVRGTVELREFDPGGEIAFALIPFTVHEPGIDFTLDLGARQGISLIPRYSAVRFDEGDNPVLFNYRRKGAEGRYNFRLSPTAVLYGYANQDRTDQRREQAVLGRVDVTSRAVGIGFRRAINQTVVTTFSSGYQSMDFRGGAERNFSGAVLDATATWTLTDTTRVELQGRRQPYQSFMATNNFYLNNYGGVRISQQFGRSLFVVLGGSYQANLYPEKEPLLGFRRRDKNRSLDLGLGYTFNPALRVFVGYNSNRRNSKSDLADYEVNRLTFRLEMGWL